MKLSKLGLSSLLILMLSACNFLQPDYLQMISSQQLNQVMQNEDIFLMDVHIPKQKHIQGTDAFIPFHSIDENINQLPTDKNTPIYIYCEGGPMGNSAARTLHELGYTQLFNLEGGSHAWRQNGFKFED